EDISDLLVFEHLVQARLLYVQNFSFKRKDRLEATVSPLLGGATGRITLDQIYFAMLRIVDRAIGQLAGKRGIFERILAANNIASFAGRLASFRGTQYFIDNSFAYRRILFEKLRELLVHDRLDDALDFGIAKFRLRL